MIKIHHIEGRRSERVAWLLDELGVPYELVYRSGDVRGSHADLSTHHPMHMAPTVEDDGETLIESGAIIDFMLRKYGPAALAPNSESPDYQRYVTYMHFAEGSAMPRILDALWPIMNKREPSAWSLAQYRNMMEFLDAELAARPYFAGDAFSAADIMMEFPLKLIPRLGGPPRPYPHIAAFLDRVYARPPYQRMIARALPNGLLD
ncbi:MAG: glutathione S-transferase family protein [Caulobacteraceae bacterium]|nr:glutathione S-transferase family protein [Caulobacteraceae bacterium]